MLKFIMLIIITLLLPKCEAQAHPQHYHHCHIDGSCH
jgi:hypothetical protein